MFKTLQNALKVKELRNKLLFTLWIIVVVRLGSQIPVPGTDNTVIKNLVSNSDGALSLFNSITGGSFESFAIFALGIGPYITASIIMQLMAYALPVLEEMQKDGEEGRKKINKITRYLTVGMSLGQALLMAISFGGSGLFGANPAWYQYIVVVLTLTAGSAMVMWLGELITENGIGNGISIVLTVNIISGFPSDAETIWQAFVTGKSFAPALLAIAIVLAIIIAVVIFVVILQDGVRMIPIIYAKKNVGHRMIGGQNSSIPLKVNTAGVMPVIFASSLMAIPAIIGQFIKNKSVVFTKVLQVLNSGCWFREGYDWYVSLGFLLYVLMIFGFAYFYTSLTFSPNEVSENIKKQGGSVPGIRPGKPTADYLTNILNYLVFIGAAGLTIVCTLPVVCAGLSGLSSLSFGGTSIIIVVGVVLETIQQLESQMLVRNYKGFLNN